MWYTISINEFSNWWKGGVIMVRNQLNQVNTRLECNKKIQNNDKNLVKCDTWLTAKWIFLPINSTGWYKQCIFYNQKFCWIAHTGE